MPLAHVAREAQVDPFHAVKLADDLLQPLPGLMGL
jgi:chloramphenicol O-acetyltransferase